MHRIPALAAVLLGDVDSGKPGRSERGQGLLGVSTMFVNIRGVRRDLLLTQVAQHRAQPVVLIGEPEQIKIGVTRPSGDEDSLLFAG